MDNPVQTTNENVKELSAVQRAVKIYSDPESAFESIREKPTWLFPVLVTIILALITIFSTTDLQLQAQKDAILKSEMIPENQKDQILENMEENQSSFVKTKILPSGMAVIGTFFYFAIGAICHFC